MLSARGLRRTLAPLVALALCATPAAAASPTLSAKLAGFTAAATRDIVTARLRHATLAVSAEAEPRRPARTAPATPRAPTAGAVPPVRSPTLLDWLLDPATDPRRRPSAPSTGVPTPSGPPMAHAWAAPPPPQLASQASAKKFVRQVTGGHRAAPPEIELPQAARSLALSEITGLERSHRRATAAELDALPRNIGAVIAGTPRAMLHGLPLTAAGALGGFVPPDVVRSVKVKAGPSMAPAGVSVSVVSF